MDEQELRVRIIMLADSAGLLVLDEDEHKRIRIDSCWVDHRVRCPYGQPESQFILRPEGFCHNACVHFPHKDIVIVEDVEDKSATALRELFNERQTTIGAVLNKLASGLGKDSPERIALELTADLISDTQRELERDILLRENLPSIHD